MFPVDPKRLRWWLSAWLLALGFASVLHAEQYSTDIYPSRPERYFNDYVHLVKPETVHKLDRALEGFELNSSNQLIVVLFSALRTDTPMEVYCQRVADAWEVGQKDTANGVVLFYFRREQRFCIAVRSGLQNALPEEKRQQIIAERIVPWIRTGDFEGAVTHGVVAIMTATQDTYLGTYHATWLKPSPPPSPLHFKDWLVPFFDVSVVVYLILGFRWLAKPGLFDATSTIGAGRLTTSGYYRHRSYSSSGSSLGGWGLGGLVLGVAIGGLISGGSALGGGKSFGGGGGASGDW